MLAHNLAGCCARCSGYAGRESASGHRRAYRDDLAVVARYLHVRSLLVSLVAAAACTRSGKPATTLKAPAASVTSYPASLYAGLFVSGARYTYTVESRRSYWDGNAEETFTGSITCSVIEVRTLPSAIASRIECDHSSAGLTMSDGPAGIYVATADGLWSVPEIPRVAPTTTKYRLFAWPPVAGEREAPDPDNPGWGSRIVVSQNSGGGWCRYVTWISGDEGDAEICVADGVVVSGSTSSAGGASYESSYWLAKT